MTAARTALMRLLNQVEPGYLAHHFGNGYEIDTIADSLLAVHLSEVVPSTRDQALNEATDALTARAGELSDMAEEELRRDLEKEAQVWHEAAEVVRKLTAPSGETTQPAQVWQSSLTCTECGSTTEHCGSCGEEIGDTFIPAPPVGKPRCAPCRDGRTAECWIAAGIPGTADLWNCPTSTNATQGDL